MTDRGHLDNNPIPVTKQDIIKCLDGDCKYKSTSIAFQLSFIFYKTKTFNE